MADYQVVLNAAGWLEKSVLSEDDLAEIDAIIADKKEQLATLAEYKKSLIYEYVTGKRTEGSIYGTFNLSRRIGQTIGNGFAIYALGWIGYDGTLDVQSDPTVFGLKVLCVLVPSVFVLGSWAAFKFVWNITPEKKAEMAAMKAAQKAE